MLWVLLAYFGPATSAVQTPYSEFKAMIRQEAFQEVTLTPSVVRGVTKAGAEAPPTTYEAVRPEDPDLLRELEARQIRASSSSTNSTPWAKSAASPR